MDEPYRRALTGMYARLAATLTHLTGGAAARHAVSPQDPYANARELLADLYTIQASLLAHHGGALVRQRLAPLIRTVDVFGFHLATVDLRQSSDQHEAVVAELLATARLCPNYASLDETAKRDLLLQLLNDQHPARDGCHLQRLDAQRTGHLRGRPRHARPVWCTSHTPLHHQPHGNRQRFARSAAVAKRSGPDARPAERNRGLELAANATSLPEGARAGLGRPGASPAICDLIVVPLFETIEDLAQSAAIMRDYYALPGVAAMVRRGSASTANRT